MIINVMPVVLVIALNLLAIGPQKNEDTLLEQVRQMNDSQKLALVIKLIDQLRSDGAEPIYAAQSLKELAPVLGPIAKEAVGPLVEALQVREPLALPAAEALAAIDLPTAQSKATPVLTSILNNIDESQLWRVMAAGVLLKIDKNPVEAALSSLLPICIDLLQSGSPRARFTVARILGDIGPAAKGSATALKVLLTDENEDVRKIAALALATIEGKPIERKK